jgi:hypothetical protein
VWVSYFPTGKLGSMTNDGIATDYLYEAGFMAETPIPIQPTFTG